MTFHFIRLDNWQNRLWILPVAIVFLKIVLALVIFLLPGKASKPWNYYGIHLPANWAYLFTAWDSVFYHAIAMNGYPSKLDVLWSYFPLYPASIRLIGLFGVDLWITGILSVTITSLASITIFQKIAGEYLDRRKAFSATLLYFVFPPVFVFTTVSYSESLFLLMSLLTWYSHIFRRDKFCALFASLTTLARPYGLLILVPLGYDFIRRKQLKNMLMLTFPLATLGAWFSYGFLKTGNLLAPLAAQSFWNSSNVDQIHSLLGLFVVHGELGILKFLYQFKILVSLGVMLLGMAAYAGFRTWRLDRTLGIYSLISLCSLVMLASTLVQTFASLPRFLSLIFPIGISFGLGNKWTNRTMLGLFVTLDIAAWWIFLFSENFH